MGHKAQAALAATAVVEDPAWLRALQAEAELEEQQDEAKAQEPVTSAQLMAYAEELIQLEEQKVQVEADLKQVNDRRKQLRTELIPEAMQALKMVNNKGKGTFTLMGYRFHLEQKLYASVSEANKPTLFRYLKERGDEELINQVISQQTLSAYVRECRGEGLNDPPGVSVHEEVTAKMTRAR